MKRRIASAAVFTAICAAYLHGVLAPIDNGLADLRAGLTPRPASGSLAIVEIDPRSLRELDVWPWPRSYHAALVDRLIAAGAATVALDIDFSSRSNAREDAALADAIRRADGRVILPAFKQVIRGSDNTRTFVETMPHPSIVGNARVGGVNVIVEPDSRVRRYLTNDTWSGDRLHSFAALLAGASALPQQSFGIDFGIRPDTVPRLSYADVMHGRFAPESVRGRHIMVGATAVELGDQLPVPMHKILPGVVVQALAYESLVQDRALVRAGPAIPLALAALLALWLGRKLARWKWQRGLASAGFASVVAAALPLPLQIIAPVTLDASPVLLVPLIAYLAHMLREIDQQTLVAFIRRMEGLHRRAMMIRVVEDSFDGVIITDHVGKVQICNRAAARLLGRDASELVGTPAADTMVLPPTLRSVTGEGGPQCLALARGDGTTFMAELNVSTSSLTIARHRRERRNIARTVFIYTFRDVTARVRAEEARTAAMEQAVAASRAKSEFLANMSHELRTPLNAIIGFSELMRMEAFGALGSPKYKSYITDIHGSAEHLLSVINDVLDMSKIETGEMTLRDSEVEVGRAVDACITLLRDRARAGSVNLAADIPDQLPLLLADERMVKQMVLNLLSNAVKFTPEGGSVRIAAATNATGFSIVVSDTGIGIAPEDLERVLQPFQQVDGSLQRKYEGTGLGLPLSKRMAELHGGALEIESALGNGTNATLRFPPERIVPAAAAAPVSAVA
jgi:PAS domain S-box-containing protein